MTTAFRTGFLALAVALAGFAALAVAQGAVGKRRITVASVTYDIPSEAKPGYIDGQDSLFMQFALPDYGPLRRDVHGWEDNVNLLITRQPDPISRQYENQWDGTPIGKKLKWNSIQNTYRIEPGFTVQEMGSGFDIVIPDQDRSTMPLGVMQCGKPKEFLPNAACELIVNRHPIGPPDRRPKGPPLA